MPELRHREYSLDEVDMDGPAMVHVDTGGGNFQCGYASFNSAGHSHDQDEDFPSDNAPPLFSKYGDFHTIDWQRDLARDRLRHKIIVGKRADFPLGIVQSAWDAGAGWICVLMVGLAAGATAGVIDIGARWMSDLKDGVCADRFWLDREHCCWSSNDTVFKGSDCSAWTTWPEMLDYYSKSPFYYILEFSFYVGWAVLMSTLAVLFVKVFAPYACGSGIPEIKCILSGFVIRGYLGKWTFIIKSVGLILSSASGLSLGKEGPMVHLACCIGNIFSYLFPKYGMNEAKKREILSASAAAGVSVAFGAPIGGVLFSLEEASYYFPLKTMWRSFFCALIAGIILRIVNPFGSNQTSLFHVDYMMKWTFVELIPFACLGLFGGILGSLFIFGNIRWSRFRKTSKTLGGNPIYEVVIITFLTAAISYFNPYMRKSASSMIKQLFDRCGPEDYMINLCDYQNKTFSSNKVDDNYHTGVFGSGVESAFWQLIMALIFKFIFTIFTFGIKVPCGLFVPSIAMGAIAGRLVGMSMESVFRTFQSAFWQLIMALIFKFIFTIFTFGIKVPCGLFVPSIAMGAIAGRLVGMSMESVFRTFQEQGGHSSYWSCQIGKDCVMPGLYAMVGAAAVLGGVTRMTVSLVVIMFELTGRLEFIVPTMVATMFAKWIGDAISKAGIYDAHIALNGYPFLDNKEEYPYSTIAVQVMRPCPTASVGSTEEHRDRNELAVIVQDGMSLGDIEQLLRETDYNGFPVVVSTNSMYLVGFVTRRDLQLALHAARKTQPYIVTDSVVYFTNQVPESTAGGPAPLRLRKIIDLAPMTVTDQTPMETVIDMFRKLGLRQVLVTKNGKVLGIITKKDILQFMRNTQPSFSNINFRLWVLNRLLSYGVDDGMSLGDIEQLLRETDYNGFPVVVSTNSMYLVGFVTRRDLQLALHAARKTQPYIVTDSVVYFTNQAPMTVTDQTPMETVIDMFRKLGLRQVFGHQKMAKYLG
ncbi:chloride transporter, ClC family [Oesophagostomum dentatum]|uniref:Chloride channel protein n=1 Tax=Oesophagostomum dentatum TaxID=61180 RepID=A0A0B1T6A6_OESDE|nr:chloride transporter, ClC family [Oesophagostomum dentatum]